VFSRRSIQFFAAVLIITSCASQAEEIVSSADPASLLLVPRLSAPDEAACRRLFEELASENFDARERALHSLVAKGPAVLPLAQHFATHADKEIAAQAKNFRQRLLLSYDGFLPTAPTVRSALHKKISWNINVSDGLSFIKELAAKVELPLYIDPLIAPADFAFEQIFPRDARTEKMGSLQEFFALYGAGMNISDIPRGDVLVLTRPDAAERLATQRHTFQWGPLGPERAEAERIAKVLAVFFPVLKTEIHTGSEAFSIRGEEESIKRASRLLALLNPGAPDAIWPAPESDTASYSELHLKLSAPATMALAAEDPLNAIAQLRKQSHAVGVAQTDAPDGPTLDQAPFPRDVDGASPLRLSLQEFPLGLVLRWIERRTRFPAQQQAELMMGFETGPGARLQFRLQPKHRAPLSLAIMGCDGAFLYPRGSRPGAESDAAATHDLREGLQTHLALFPSCPLERDLVVLRGRIFMQAPYATCSRARDLIREWRSKNARPEAAAWHSILHARLRTVIEWDGAGIGGGRLLPTLRKMGKIAILLDDSADGRAPSFQFTPKQAELLAPGRHPLSQLLDELAKVAEAEWSVELGAVVLRPKSETVKK